MSLYEQIRGRDFSMNTTLMAQQEAAGLRALAYRFLSAFYLDAPQPGWLADLYREGLLAEFPVPAENDEMCGGLALLAAAAQQLSDGQLTDADVAADHQALFVGPGHLPAPPWESVYRSKENLLYDWPTLSVRAAYQAMGLAVDRPGQPDDHMGLELLFMAVLCEREAAGDAEAREARRRFVKEHLLEWAPAFCADVRTHAATAVYRGVASLTLGLLQDEHA
jgi:putative dimethyl sulfoxide reductase chaperone